MGTLDKLNMRVLALLSLCALASSTTIYYASYSDTGCTTFSTSPSIQFAYTAGVCSCFGSSSCTAYVKLSVSGTTITYENYASDSTCSGSPTTLTYTSDVCASTLKFSTSSLGAQYTWT